MDTKIFDDNEIWKNIFFDTMQLLNKDFIIRENSFTYNHKMFADSENGFVENPMKYNANDNVYRFWCTIDSIPVKELRHLESLSEKIFNEDEKTVTFDNFSSPKGKGFYDCHLSFNMAPEKATKLILEYKSKELLEIKSKDMFEIKSKPIFILAERAGIELEAEAKFAVAAKVEGVFTSEVTEPKFESEVTGSKFTSSFQKGNTKPDKIGDTKTGFSAEKK